MFYRQDDAFNILELCVNHIDLFIFIFLFFFFIIDLLNVRFIKIIILQYDVQAKMYDVFVLIQLILLGG